MQCLFEIPCVYVYYTHVYHITKSRGPGLYNSLRHADNKIYFSGLSLREIKGKRICFTWQGSEKNLEMYLLRKR